METRIHPNRVRYSDCSDSQGSLDNVYMSTNMQGEWAWLTTWLASRKTIAGARS